MGKLNYATAGAGDHCGTNQPLRVRAKTQEQEQSQASRQRLGGDMGGRHTCMLQRVLLVVFLEAKHLLQCVEHVIELVVPATETKRTRTHVTPKRAGPAWVQFELTPLWQ